MRFDVYVGERKVGLIEQAGVADYIFSYLPTASTPISLTMPVRLESYKAPFLHPVFQVSLPEGNLRHVIETQMGKRMSYSGDLAVLSIVGASLIGRLAVIPEGSNLPSEEEDATELLADVLSHGASKEMLADFISKHAESSGVSGGYLKVLAHIATEKISTPIGRWIVKYTDENHPYLALNEYLSMLAARAGGLDVPVMRLSDDGQTLLVQRFDVVPNGRLGFEDMCSLTGVPASQKFLGSVESIVKTIRHYAAPKYVASSLRSFFRQYACATMLRNGDAHLKNFGMIYSADQDTRLSPCFDMATMSAYAHFLQNGKVDDMMALTLAGSKRWPTRKHMLTLACRCGIKFESDVDAILEEVAQGIASVAPAVEKAIQDRPDFADIGGKMLRLWDDGLGSMGFNLSEIQSRQAQDRDESMPACGSPETCHP